MIASVLAESHPELIVVLWPSGKAGGTQPSVVCFTGSFWVILLEAFDRHRKRKREIGGGGGGGGERQREREGRKNRSRERERLVVY